MAYPNQTSPTNIRFIITIGIKVFTVWKPKYFFDNLFCLFPVIVSFSLNEDDFILGILRRLENSLSYLIKYFFGWISEISPDLD